MHGGSCALWRVCVGTARGIEGFLEIVFHPIGNANAEHFSGENLKLFLRNSLPDGGDCTLVT